VTPEIPGALHKYQFKSQY